MDTILSFIGIRRTKNSRDDDISDRLNSRTTVYLLIAFAGIVTTKQFVGESMSCWVPDQFSKEQDEYTKSYCWIKNTYKLDIDANIPKEHESHKRKMVTYYQWVPLILLVQALMFYAPHAVWKTFSVRSGIDLSNMVEAGITFTATEMMEVREKTLKYMTSQMDRYLARFQSRVYRSPTVSLKPFFAYCVCLRGSYLVSLFFIVKILYVANVIGQIFFLDFFLGSEYSMYGVEVIKDLANRRDWSSSSRFPRTTMCDFKIRVLGNIHRYTVQCVLPINQFNEFIYLFLWFWLWFVAAISIVSLLVWLVRITYKAGREEYVKKHLEYIAILDSTQKKHVKFFVDYLKQDGLFVMRMLAVNADTITATEFINSLWENYESKDLIRGRDEVDGIQGGSKKGCFTCCVPICRSGSTHSIQI